MGIGAATATGWRHRWRQLGYLLLPPRCLVCGQPGAPQRDLCAACLAGLPFNRPACLGCGLPLPDAAQELCGRCQRRPLLPGQVHPVFVYAVPVDHLLRRFKFHQDLVAGQLLAELMAGELHAAPRPQAVVPVPLHTGRLRERGYDQARELALTVARALELPLYTGLCRQRATAAQSTLDRAQRRRNLRDAFVARAPVPAHVALVDDVMTTGATLRAACKALQRAGATRVDAWVCARVP